MKEKNMVSLYFDKKLYSSQAIQRVLKEYVRDYFIEMKEEEGKMIVLMEGKEKNIDGKKLKKEVENQVLEEEVRVKIEEETKTIRNQLWEKALKMR